MRQRSKTTQALPADPIPSVATEQASPLIRSRWFGPIVLVAATLLMFADVFLGSNVVLSHFGADLSVQLFAWREFGFSELRSGNLPLWNPYIFSGAPFVGGFQSAMFYPPNLLHLVTSTATSINVLIAAHLFLLGLFTYVWVLRQHVQPLVATLAGTLIMFSGPVFPHVYAGHLPNLYTMAWTPLLLIAVDGLCERPHLKWILVGAIAASLQILAGHPQYVVYTALAVVLYAVTRAIATPHRWRMLAGLAASYAGAAAVCAAQLLAGWAATAESIRSRPLPYEMASTFSFPIENLLTAVAPGFFGDMGTVPYWGRWNMWETSLFVGGTAIVLAGYGAVSPGRHVRAAVATAGVLFLLALGDQTPLFHALYSTVPGFGGFRGSSKFTFPFVLFVVLLAGVGFDRVLSVSARRSWLISGTVTVAGVAAIVGAWILLAGGNSPSLWSTWLLAIRDSKQSFLEPTVFSTAGFVTLTASHAGVSVLIAAGSLLVTAILLHCLRFGQGAAYALALVAVVGVFAHARMVRPAFDAEAIESQDIRELALRAHTDSRVFNPSSPNGGMIGHYRDIWGHDPGVPLRYAEFMAFTQGIDPDNVTQYLAFNRPNPLFRMLRLRHVVQVVNGGTGIIDLHKPMPRALLVHDYAIRPGRDEIFAAMALLSFDPRRTVILESEPIPAPDRGGSELVPIRVTDDTTDTFTIEAQLNRAALLVITDSYSAHWHATALPGSAQARYQVMPANYAIMVVPLSAGRHAIRLEYAPTAFRVGVWISIVSTTIMGGLVMLAGVRRFTRLREDRRKADAGRCS